jgi:hypothetical protein
MREEYFAQRLAAHLDESADQLPYRVSHRLELARLRAVAAAQQAPALAVAPVQAALFKGAHRPDAERGRWWFRTLSFAPLVLIVAGFLAISAYDDFEKAADTANLDEEILVDDVPIQAYADKGFGVFLKNSAD